MLLVFDSSEELAHAAGLNDTNASCADAIVEEQFCHASTLATSNNK